MALENCVIWCNLSGYVTCYHPEDIALMQDLLSQTPPEILQAGLHPTFDQIEMYAYHLPHAGLSNLIDIFVSLSKVVSLFFIIEYSHPSN